MYLGSHHRVAAYDEEDSDSDDDVIDVLSADHCTGEHSYTMQMPTSMVLQARKAAQRKAAEEVPDLIPELQSGYRLLQYLTSPACQKYSSAFMKPFDTEQKEYKSYNKVIANPMWFDKVKEGLESNTYTTITEVIRDVRLILENCYRFFGPSHSFSKRAVKLETVLEQKLALLPRELREKTSIEATTLNGLDHTTFKGRRARLSLLSSEMSPLMSYVKSQSTARAREERLKQREERRFEKEVAQQVACDWDKETFEEGLAKIATMWEVPQVCQFLALAQPVLNLPEIAMCEVERMFLMPQQSTLLSTVMTCLLVSPHHRSRVLQKGPMPYRIWQDRLNTKLALWYKTYHSSQRNANKVFEVHGVEQQFFQVLGDTSPLETKSFHELEVAQRVWLVKTLCDYKLQHHKMVQDHFAEQEADRMRETVLGEDAAGDSYLYFPILSVRDLRVYRRGRLAPTEYCFVPPMKRTPPRRPFKKPKRKKRAEPSAMDANPSKRPARLRQVIKPSLRHSHRRETITPRSAASEQEGAVEEGEESNQEEDVEVGTPLGEEEPKQSSFTTVATSVADLRSIVALLEQKVEGNESVATRSRAKREESPIPGDQTRARLAADLRVLLSEMELCESRFLQTEAAIRLKLYKEWHAFANKTDDQEEGNRHEEAWNAWTIRYRDEDDGVFDDSEEDDEEEAMVDEEYREDTGATAEPPGDGNTVRVLRKRKIVVPNGDFNWPSWGAQESPQANDSQPSTDSEKSSKPCAESSEMQRFDPDRLKPDTVAAVPSLSLGRSNWEDPASIPCSALQTLNSKAEPILCESAGPKAEAKAEDTDLGPVVAPSKRADAGPVETRAEPGTTSRKVLADHLTKMFANAVPRSLFSKRTYARPVKINELLGARLRATSVVEKPRGTPNSTRQLPAEKPNEINPIRTSREVVRVKTSEPREAALKRASNVVPQKRERQTIRKMTLVPAMDKRGENAFLRVEYARVPDGVPPSAAGSKRTTLQTPRFYTASPLKYGISSEVLAPTAREISIERPRQENRRPTILKVRPDAQGVPRTFNLPWWKKKNGIAVSAHAREVPGEKKFFRSKNSTNCDATEMNPAARNAIVGHVEDLGTATRQGATEENVLPNVMAQHDVENVQAERNVTPREVGTELGMADHCGMTAQEGIPDQQDFAAQQQCVAVQHGLLPQALCHQNAVLPLQNFGVGGPSDNVVVSQGNGAQAMYLLPEVMNSIAAAQQQTMLLQQPKIVDPSTFLNPPPDSSPVAQPDQIPQLPDLYAMQAVSMVPGEQILQSCVESCLLPADFGQDALVNVVQQPPEDPAVQQQPVFLLTSDGRLLQIVHSS